jgi:DNA (cytosine-5)-methyltransferase 1
MTFIDLFAGIGAARFGFERAGHKCVGYVEKDKFARRSYEAIHDAKDEWSASDIREVKGEEMPEADLYTFGFPCQPFSVAGDGRGFSDRRGDLIFEVVRLVGLRKPKYLFAENVKGLLGHNGGETFKEILRAFDELGYDIQWQIIDSADFVPQHRERLYFVGHLRGVPRPKVFPIVCGAQADIELQEQQAIASTITAGYRETKRAGNYIVESKQRAELLNLNRGASAGDRVYDSNGIAPCLNVGGGRVVNPMIVDRRGAIFNVTPGAKQGFRVFDENGIAPTLLNDKQGGYRKPMIVQRSRGNNKGGMHEIAPTISSNCWQLNNVLSDGDVVRFLTPLECWRLQGFDDEAFYKAKSAGISDNQLYKQAGNSMTIPVIEAIASRII